MLANVKGKKILCVGPETPYVMREKKTNSYDSMHDQRKKVRKLEWEWCTNYYNNFTPNKYTFLYRTQSYNLNDILTSFSGECDVFPPQVVITVIIIHLSSP